MKKLVPLLISLAVCTCASAQISLVPEDEQPGDESALNVQTDDKGVAADLRACLDIEQEVRQLENSIQAHKQTLEKAAQSLILAGTEVAASASQMSTGGSLGRGLQAGISVLGMVPGVSALGNLAAGIALGSATSAVSQTQIPIGSSEATQGALQTAMESQQSLYRNEMRHQYLVGLFLDRRCPLQ